MSSSISSSSFRTAEDTESSSMSSRVGDVGFRRGGRTVSDMIANCLVCCWPEIQGEKPHNDCFFAIDCSSPHAAYPNTIEVITYTSGNTTSICIGQTQPVNNGNDGNEKEDPLKRTISPSLLQENAKEVGDILAILSPLTVNIKASEQTKNGATKTTTENSLHRRTDDTSNLGFFTPHTLEAIHTDLTKIVVASSNDQDGRQIFGASKGSAFCTPSTSARHDMVSIRRSIDFVTCEERKSPDGPHVERSAFSSSIAETSEKRKNGEKQVTNGSLTPIQMRIDGCPKKLVFDPHTPDVSISSPSIDLFGWNLAQVATPISMSRQLSPLEEVLKALQSIVRDRPGGIHNKAETKDCPIIKDNVPIGTTPPTNDLPVTSESTSEKTNRLPWRDDFLRKSPSFPKALRQSGRSGKVVIEGWVAFRGDVTWKEIVGNPKRSDFRYVVLLDDKPLLHMFRSGRSVRRRKSKAAKRDHLHGCKSLDLTAGDIAVRVNLVSKEMGNEVCIFDQETGVHHCGLLAIPMPECAFLDGHRSRLSKEAPMGVFGPYKKVVTFASSSSSSSSNNDDRPAAAADAAIYFPSPVEQNDASRYLLFTIDVIIKFPPPRAVKVPPPRAADATMIDAIFDFPLQRDVIKYPPSRAANVVAHDSPEEERANRGHREYIDAL